MLLTGRNAIKNGVLGNSHFLRPDLVACGIRTWPQILSDAGYLTASIGKMHFYPWHASMGFEHRVICEDKRWLAIQDDYYHHLQAKVAVVVNDQYGCNQQHRVDRHRYPVNDAREVRSGQGRQRHAEP